MNDYLELESRPEMVAGARRFVRGRLTAWELPEHVDDAVLVASELVSNAVLHARTGVKLTVIANGLSSVRVEVYDENTRAPAVAWCPTDATSGRGLNVVAALATSWGIENRDDGKVVWAQLGVESQSHAADCLDLTGAEAIERELQAAKTHPDPTEIR